MKKTLALILLVTGISSAFAQKGSYVSLWAGPQLTGIANSSDYFGTENGLDTVQIFLEKHVTTRFTAGFSYVYNWASSYGIQTGIYYSQEGQNYKGKIGTDYNNPSSHDSVNFNSHLYINYVKVPFAFRMTSENDEEDKVTLSMYLGLQVGIRAGVSSYTSPPPPDSLVSRNPDFNLNKLYNPVVLGIIGGAEFNIKVKPSWGITFGVKFDRSLQNIENLTASIPKNAPAEWYFPVSTKKQFKPDLLIREPSKSQCASAYIGVHFRLDKEK